MRDCGSGQPDPTAVTVSAGRHKVPDGRDGAQNRTGAADFAAARQLARRFVRADVFARAAAARRVSVRDLDGSSVDPNGRIAGPAPGGKRRLQLGLIEWGGGRWGSWAVFS